MNNTLILTYYLGIIACSLIGAQLAANQHNRILSALSSITCAFGGGLLRDLVILHCHPWLFTTSAIPDLIIVILASLFITSRVGSTITPALLSRFILVSDSLGMIAMINLGVNKGQSLSVGSMRCIISGYFTVCYGSIILNHNIAYFLSPQTLSYHAVTVLCTVLYHITKSVELLCITTIYGLALRHVIFFTLHESQRSITSFCSHIKLFATRILKRRWHLRDILRIMKHRFYWVNLSKSRPHFFSTRLRFC